MEVLNAIQASPIMYTLAKVAGHADDEKSFDYKTTPKCTRRNIDMDKQARLFQKNPPYHLTTSTKLMFYPAQRVNLRILGNLILGDIAHQINLYRHDPPMETSIQSSLSIHGRGLTITGWKGIEVYLPKTDPIVRIGRAKIIHRLWLTNVVIHRRSPERSLLCLRCKSFNDTFEHFFQCGFNHSKQIQLTVFEGLRSRLRKFKSHPVIIQGIMTMLVQYHRNQQPSCPVFHMGNPNRLSFLK